MRILLTAGPTYEPIDPVRFIGNRSSGQMGTALARAALNGGHEVTAVVGPITAVMPAAARRIDVTTTREMYDAVLLNFPAHDLLIMAAAVADFRPRKVAGGKIDRSGSLTIELEPTEDIAAAAGAIKRPNQRSVGFSLVDRDAMQRSREKLAKKNLDLIVYNPIETINSPTVTSILLYPDGRSEELSSRSKSDFADILLQRALALFR